MRTLTIEEKSSGVLRSHRRSRRRQRRFFRTFLVVLIAAVFLIAVFCLTARQTEAEDPELPYKYYTSIQVESGDTLWSIAEEHMTPNYPDTESYIREVKEINHLGADDTIKAGSSLCIPYYSSEKK